MRKRIQNAIPAAAILTLAGQLFAGGFFLQLGNPEASPEARKLNAVITVKTTGCHHPETATLTAAAIGTVNGQRREIPLKVERLSEPGMFAVAQQWPNEGRWVIRLEGHNGEQFTNTLIAAGPNGLDRIHAKADMKAFGPSDVDSMLRD